MKIDFDHTGRPFYCFRVSLPTTNASRDTAEVCGKYLAVDGGNLYVVAQTVEEVAQAFPPALNIRRLGLAVRLVP